MQIGSLVIRSPFAKADDSANQSVQQIPSTMDHPMAWADELMVRGIEFPRYNPDLLITVKGHDIYRSMMVDEQIKAVVQFRRDAVTGRNYDFVIEDEEEQLSEEECKFRIALFNHIVEVLPKSFKTRMDMIMSSLYQGYSLTEKVYKHVEFRGKTWVGVDSLRKKPYSTFEFYVDEYGRLEHVVQRVAGEELEFDPNKFIHHVHNIDFDEYYGRSELREAYRAWWSKDIVIKLYNIYMERMAGGFVWAEVEKDSGINSQSREFGVLKDILNNINGKTGLILPPGVKLNVEHPTDTEAFEKSIAVHDKAISKSLLMPNLLGLSEQGDTGSYSQSQTQLEAFLWMLNAEATSLEETLNEQLFKELGDINFGDGIYPRFKFKPLSETQKAQIISQWKDLVSANAVESTDEDQAHLRELIGFPPHVPDEEEAKPTPSSSALSGIQVKSLIEVLDKVAVGDLEKSTAIIVITESFPISEARAAELVNSVKPREKELPPPAPGQPPATGDQGGETDPPDGGGEDDPPDGSSDEEELDREHEIVGQGRAIVSAFDRAKARVAFAVIDRQGDDLQEDFVPRISGVFAEWLGELTLRIEQEKIGTGENTDLDPVKKISLDNRTKQRLQNAFKAMLREGWRIGQKHAGNELDMAKGQSFTRSNVDFARLEQQAADFFDAKVFTITGRFTEEALSTVRNELLNGIKASKSTKEVIDGIYGSFATKGMLTKDDIRQALGEALEVDNPDARLRTIVNTNTFEAINESRYAFFTDPSLQGFVPALRYSAILDSRTTEICKGLDDHVHSADGSVWNGPYRPPNHFNCRSVLIPITEVDGPWEESDPPNVQPQEGFS